MFLAAKTKGELPPLVQSSLHAEALAQGRADAENAPDALGAVMAIAQRVVTRNRSHVGNGCVYLRETAFGDPTEPRHQQALAITAHRGGRRPPLGRTGRLNESDVATPARVVSAVLFLARAASVNATASVDEIPRDIRDQPVALRVAALPPTGG
ncbi:hypothetical protein [Streptomyces sp. SS]|uniref:hypothetical protein n=1 Tax=Streptomyces sp. SS TaxID=260742 RepID=UPI000380DA01|nr:hypothetical protein [Streptomyces sp. SS]